MSRQCFDCAWSPKNMTSLVPEAGHNSIRFWQKSRVFFQVLIRISLTNIFGMSCSKYWVRAPSWAFYGSYGVLTHPGILLARDWSVSNTCCEHYIMKKQQNISRVAPPAPTCEERMYHQTLGDFFAELFLDWGVPLLSYSFAEIFRCWTIPLRNYSFKLFLYVPLQGDSFTELFLCWRFAYWTVLLLQIFVYRKFLHQTSVD